MGMENLREKEIQELILEEIKIGWWIINDDTATISISDFVRKQLRITDSTINYDTFIQIVREDYRDRIQRELISSNFTHTRNYILPLNISGKETWIQIKEIKKEKRNSHTIGYLQFIENPEITSPEKASSLRTNNLLFQLNSVSQILLSFLTASNPDDVINKVLKDILKQFKAGRTYIFEYDWDKAHQTCTYEAVDNNVKPEIDLLFQLPFEKSAWWTQKMSAGEAIILSTLDDLPKEAASEKELLTIQNINSLLVVPLMSKNGAWGYAGIDIVDGHHDWTKEDKEWVASLFNIISLCIQLQRSENEAHLDKTYLRNLYENMPVGYMRINISHNKENNLKSCELIDINTAAEDLFEEKLSEKIGNNTKEVSLNFEKILPYIEKVLDNQSYVNTKYHVEKSNKYTQLIIYSIQKDEVICLFSDITESELVKRKLIEAKEKAEQSDILKSAFLANMSHEIRTPLNAIIGFSDLLIHATDRDERTEYADIVYQNNELLLQLISDILDLSKIESGTLEIINGYVDVEKLISEILHYYQLKTEGNPVKVILEKSFSPCIIYSDRNRLTQILNNFINNALKFTTKGCISIGYYLSDNEHIKFYVKDTGVGISPKNINNVFKRFVKLNHFVTGTGLGLSICQSLVQQMNGEIGAESELGKGSLFWFTHPYNKNISQ